MDFFRNAAFGMDNGDSCIPTAAHAGVQLCRSCVLRAARRDSRDATSPTTSAISPRVSIGEEGSSAVIGVGRMNVDDITSHYKAVSTNANKRRHSNALSAAKKSLPKVRRSLNTMSLRFRAKGARKCRSARTPTN